MDAGKRTINDIFNGNRILEIPFFQRAYVWGDDQWESLLEDMQNVSISNKPYFLGSVILKQQPTNTGNQFGDIRTLIDTAIAHASYTTILERVRAVYASPNSWHEISRHPADQIARHVSARIEGLTAQLLHNRFVYAAMRALFRTARFVTGRGWSS